jgi:hypothetical protein
MTYCSLVLLGSSLRLLLRDIPNFAPVAALGLFAGFWFRQRVVAMSLPLSVMLISDLVLGAYQWQMMTIVYSMLLLPALCGGPLRRHFEKRQGRQIWRPTATLLICSLSASLAFFAVTNFGAWLWFDSYPRTFAGLAQCYLAALPFFRYTIAGDLLFGTVLFGSYASACALRRRRYWSSLVLDH